MSARKLGIDYGEKRIGIAVSDPLGFTARGVGTVFWNGKDIEKAVEKIKGYAEEFQVDAIIVGLPLRTDGKPGESEEKAKNLALEIRKAVPATVILRDERYTSVMANRILKETGGGKNRKSGETDRMAAEILLAEYLRQPGGIQVEIPD